jgi:hypothetical protein
VLGYCWKEGGESLKSKIIYSPAGRLGGCGGGGGGGGGEWFGGVITKGREGKGRQGKVNVGFGFGFGFGYGPESDLAQRFGSEGASFQVAVMPLASCRGDKRLARVLIVRYKYLRDLLGLWLTSKG